MSEHRSEVRATGDESASDGASRRPAPAGNVNLGIRRPTGVRALAEKDWFRRLVSCLGIGVVLKLVTGTTGVQTDYLYAIKKDFSSPSLLIWLAVGVIIWAGFTFAPLIQGSLHKPGANLCVLAVLPLIISAVLQPWYTPDGYKFFDLAPHARDTAGLAPLAVAYFGWLVYVLVAGSAILTGLAFTGRRPFQIAAVLVDVVAIAMTWSSQKAVVDFGPAADHSNGWWLLCIAFALVAAGVLVNALSHSEIADPGGTVDRVLSWRPGVLPIVLGVLACAYGLLHESWLYPKGSRLTFADLHDATAGSGLSSLATAYFGWLGYLLTVVCALLGVLGMLRRDRILGLGTAVLGAVGLVITLISLHAVTSLAAENPKNGLTGPWQQLDHGGWLTCGGFFLFAGGGLVVYRQARRTGSAASRAAGSATSAPAPAQDGSTSRQAGWFKAPGSSASVLALVAGLALFLPQILSVFWQGVAVDQIGTFVLLAVGLNVVVGWAGLLDLGFVAFYAIGAYIAAYFAGALPAKPPFHAAPIMVIPIAVGVCLLAGLILGAPTLRLRGDYLAIVTLGFGEIVRIIANNSDGVTNGSRGPTPGVIKPFAIHIGPLHIQWASSGLLQASIQYWYLLLAIIALVVLAFRRMEYSRIGRTWAAIREDEVAAQATGINTVKFKLMAFAIGASTSGLAGVIYASKIGSFTPDNFTLQISILIVAYVVFGGMGSLPGAMAGAAVLTWLPQFLKDYVPNEDRFIYIGGVLVIMMIFRPAGLIPARRRALELSGLHPEESETRAVPVGEGLGGLV
ncbi:MAG: branched-chain amino acid ABC transporter permease [Jatrophihabitans sp.]